MVARISFVAALCLLVGVVAGCGGDSRRAESETTESAAQSETETVPAPQPSGTEPVHVSKVTDPARRAYVTQVDAVCERFDPERGKDQQRVGSATRPEEAAREYESTISLGWKELRQIEKIGEPAGDAAVLKANVYDPIRHQLALRREIKAALAAVDVPKLTRLRAELDTSTQALTGFARGYGFQVCGEG